MAVIRPEQPHDRPAIGAVLLASFPTAGEARLADRLRESGQLRISLVAEAGGNVVGYVAFSPVTVEKGNSGLGLAPLAVISSQRRQGIAAELVRAGLPAAPRVPAGWSSWENPLITADSDSAPHPNSG